jgi:hypothetical protein
MDETLLGLIFFFSFFALIISVSFAVKWWMMSNDVRKIREILERKQLDKND